MKYLITIFLLFPLVSFAQKLTKNDSAYAKDVLRLVKTNKQVQVNGLIGDKETAIAIAEPILFKVYGRPQILGEKPYHVILYDGYWILSGSLSEGYTGGTFLIVLSAKDASVVGLTHYK